MRGVVLLCGLILGCGAPRRLEPCAPSATGTMTPQILISLTGAPTEVELLLPPAVFCPKGNPVATSVVTEVLDSMNQPVAHVHSEPTSSNTNGYSTRVTFTPTSRGVLYLTARFEPALGLARRQHQVALERSGEAPWASTRLGALCDEVAALGSAVWCRRGGRLELSRAGAVIANEPAVGMKTAGDVGWSWTSSSLSRVVERDGGLVRAELTLAIAPGAIAVTEDRWLLGNDAGFVEVSVGADGGLSARSWTVEAAFAPISGPGLALAGEVAGWSTGTRVCAGAPDASVSCVDTPLQSLAGEGSALWLRGVESGVVAQARISSDGGVPLVLFVPAQGNALMDARQPYPAFAWNGMLIAVRAEDLSFEAWGVRGTVARQTVTGPFVVFQLQSGETIIFKR